MDVNNPRILALGLLAAVLAAFSPVHAQRVLEVPVRTGVGADALATGPVALFWNAASIGLPAGRGEALILDTRGPTPTGMAGVAVAGVYRLDERTALAAGFQHSGIEDIERTTTSPLPSGGAVAIDISENTFAAAVLRQLDGATSVGATVRYTRVSEIVGGDAVAAVGAGGRRAFRPRAGFRPVVAVGAFVDGDGADWLAGASLDRSIGADSAWSLAGEYGVRGSPRFEGIEHRVGLMGALRERLRVGIGVAIEPGAEGRTVEPTGSVSLSISRYVVGVVREQLPNDLGAMHQFRLSLTF